MEFFVDTADINEIKRINDLGILDGVTTNPSLIAKSNKNFKKLMPFLHLPVQSGSNKILKLMNRKHTIEHYYSVVEKLLKARKDIELSSDFIVGYPGELQTDFEKTIEFYHKNKNDLINKRSSSKETNMNNSL